MSDRWTGLLLTYTYNNYFSSSCDFYRWCFDIKLARESLVNRLAWL